MKTNQLSAVAPPLSFRHFLQAELVRRCNRNRQYSLRAFAKFLELDHSTLSQLLRGKRRLTARTIRRCGIRLGLDEDSIAEFVGAEERGGSSDDSALGDVRRLASDTACLLAEWQHYAILELVRLRDFRPDSRWIARVLGLSLDEVNIALQRLLRLGLLTMDESTRWTDRSGNTTASVHGFTQAALRQLIEQSRQRLLESVGAAQTDRCAYQNTTLAIAADRVPNVLDRIERFQRELLALVRSDDGADDVYQLELSFFPLTQQPHEDHDHGATCHPMADHHPPT